METLLTSDFVESLMFDPFDSYIMITFFHTFIFDLINDKADFSTFHSFLYCRLFLYLFSDM